MDGLKSWLPHLDVLRWHVVRMLAVWLVTGGLVFMFRQPVLEVLVQPMRQVAPQVSLLTTGVTELFAVYLKLAVWGGLLLSLPYMVLEIWWFVRPALYRREVAVVASALLVVPLLTLAGVAFGWWLMLPPILTFFTGFEAGGVVAMPRLADYIGLVSVLLGMLGVAFNLPLVLVALVRLGLVRVATLRRQRRAVIVVIFVVAAVATPPDPFSQILLAVPLWFLFEVAVAVAARVEREE